MRGREEGIAIGEERGVARGIIRSGRKYGATDAQIKADLVEQLNMSTGDAERASGLTVVTLSDMPFIRTHLPS